MSYRTRSRSRADESSKNTRNRSRSREDEPKITTRSKSRSRAAESSITTRSKSRSRAAENEPIIKTQINTINKNAENEPIIKTQIKTINDNAENKLYKKYELLEEGEYDSIVFIIAHSNLAGDEQGKLCRLETTNLIQQTLLVGNINANCIIYNHPDTIYHYITKRFEDALLLSGKDIEDITYTTKGILRGDHPNLISRDPNAKRYFDSRGKFSNPSNKFCERTWYFFDQTPKGNTPFGKIILLTRDDKGLYYPKGTSYFAPLFEEKIKKGTFTLKKSDLYKTLSGYDGIGKVLLVDFGCTQTHPLMSQNNLNSLHRGSFGGRKKTKKTKRRKNKRY